MEMYRSGTAVKQMATISRLFIVSRCSCFPSFLLLGLYIFLLRQRAGAESGLLYLPIIISGVTFVSS